MILFESLPKRPLHVAELPEYGFLSAKACGVRPVAPAAKLADRNFGDMSGSETPSESSSENSPEGLNASMSEIHATLEATAD